MNNLATAAAATGCLAGAGLLLALSTVPAGAQQRQQQPPQQECFAVAMNNQASVGSILLDKCAGKTWLLSRVPLGATGNFALRWLPVTVGTSEPVGGPQN
jgi:hypothetical protein